MAVLAAAALLDELMGRNRNILPHEKAKELNWEDPEYCKYFMVKFCPHDLFVNTKADLGACAKVHDEEIRKIFSKAKGHRKLQYQEDFLRYCTQMVNDVERRIQKGRQRLALISSKDSAPTNPAQVQRNEEQIDILNERINGLEKEAEEAGNNGNVEQAQGLMRLCDQLKEERDQLKRQNESGHRSAIAELASAQEKLMEVCEVCGAFLIVGDAQQRIDDHLMGKQHMGFARLKTAIDEVAAAVQATKDERKNKSDDRRFKDMEREKEKNDTRESTSKERERSHHREHRDRSEYRTEKERSTSEKRDKDKEKKDKERRDSGEYYNREKLSRDRDRERRYQDTGRDYKSHRHSSSHRRH